MLMLTLAHGTNHTYLKGLNMFDWIKKLFGEGKIRAEFELADGRSGIAKVPYIGQYDENKMLAHIKNSMQVEYGSKVTSLKITEHVGF